MRVVPGQDRVLQRRGGCGQAGASLACAATGLGLKEAKALVDEAPKPVKEGIDREEADKLRAGIEEAGGTVQNN